MMHLQNRRGYTLVELLVVLAILGVLAALALPATELHAQRERERELKRALWEVRDAIDAYHAAHRAGRIQGAVPASGYPASLQALADGMVDLQTGRILRFLRQVPRDPFADPSLPAAQTWAVRSYRSPPDQPEPGEDVYDVRSRSPVVGLNGVPVNEW